MFKEVDHRQCFIGPLEVKSSNISGFGVFATDFIKKHSIIEKCPYVSFSRESLADLAQLSMWGDTIHHILFDYVFEIPGTADCAVCFGWGSIYNHSDEDNASWKVDKKNRIIKFYAKRDIEKGEEILTRYLRDTTSVEFSEGGTLKRWRPPK